MTVCLPDDMPEIERELFHADLRLDLDGMLTMEYGIEPHEITGSVKLINRR